LNYFIIRLSSLLNKLNPFTHTTRGEISTFIDQRVQPRYPISNKASSSTINVHNQNIFYGHHNSQEIHIPQGQTNSSGAIGITTKGINKKLGISANLKFTNNLSVHMVADSNKSMSGRVSYVSDKTDSKSLSDTTTTSEYISLPTNSSPSEIFGSKAIVAFSPVLVGF